VQSRSYFHQSGRKTGKHLFPRTLSTASPSQSTVHVCRIADDLRTDGWHSRFFHRFTQISVQPRINFNVGVHLEVTLCRKQ